MKIFDEERAQGATEYLLMIAVAVTVVAIAIVYVTEIRDDAADKIDENKDNMLDDL